MTTDPLTQMPRRVIGQTRPTSTLAERLRVEFLRRKWARKGRVQTRPRGWVKQGRDAK